MKTPTQKASRRLAISCVLGLIAGGLVALSEHKYLAPLVGWDVAAGSFLLQIWLRLWPLGSSETRAHALREDPTHTTAHGTMLLAAVASLGAALLVLGRQGTKQEQALLALLTIGSIVLSWAVIHTLYALHYAVMYFTPPEGGVDFNQKEDPSYSDFAYLAFTIGMTFQVSDNTFGGRKFRKVALAHALFAYLFGTIIIAATINLIAGLGS